MILRSIMLLLLSRFSRVRLCATPETAAHWAPLSLGFSRQEHWSGLPFPSPTYESENWEWSHSVVSDSLRPHGLQPTRLLHPWDFPGKNTGVGCHCLLHDSRLAYFTVITTMEMSGERQEWNNWFNIALLCYEAQPCRLSCWVWVMKWCGLKELLGCKITFYHCPLPHLSNYVTSLLGHSF